MKDKKLKGHGIRYLAPSALMVFITFIFAVTATFAWFSMNMSSKVSIYFEVTSQEGLMIAVKQWKHREVTATKTEAGRIEAVKSENGEYIYQYNGEAVRADQQNLHNINNKYYVYIAANGAQANPEYITEEGGKYYLFCTDAANPDTAIDAKLFENSRQDLQNQNVYVFSGDILLPPEDSDYGQNGNKIIEELLAKVCMNDKNAEKITDPLTNATTPIDNDGNATTIVGLTERDGSGFSRNAYTGGDRYTASFSGGMSATTVYKYQFDLYFKSATNQAITLNTNKSAVTSEISESRRKSQAWKDLYIDNYTDSINQKNQYIGYSDDGQWVPEGAEIFAQPQNAIRIGISDSMGNPVAIWDPNSTQGWTKNNPENNMALHYYNQAMETNLNRAPANANLTAATKLCQNMRQESEEVFKTSLKVTVWLEGFDADCLDSLMSKSMNIALSFAGQTPDI